MKHKILIVDDEPHILKALGRLLRHENISVLMAESGEAALAIMQQEPVLLVISDFKMPGMCGTELLAKIEASWPDTVRIILSGHSDFETVLQAVHSGVVHKFLAKPWNNQELIEHIRTSLAQVDHSRDKLEAKNDPLHLSPRQFENHSTSQIQLQVVLDTVFDGIATINRKGVILSVNKAIERIFGYNQRELVGRNISCLMPEPYRSQHDHYLAQYQEPGSKGIIGNQRRLVGLRKNGEVFPIELGVNSMQVEGEVQFLGMIRDISRRVSAESENQLLIGALEVAQDGFALFGPGDRLLHWNQQFRQLYQECEAGLTEGIRYEAFFQLCIQNGLFVEAQSNPDRWLAEQCEAHKNLPIIKQYELKPGRWIEIHETRAENGSVIVSHLDISQLKQTQISLQKAVDQAEHANSARGRFLAMMSHEIRTPLNGVLGLLQLLQESSLSAAQSDYVDTALVSGRSLLTIISDILDFTKIEADKLNLINGPCSINRLCHELIQLFRLRVEEKSIQLTLSIDDRLPDVLELDGQRLRQVLLNLLGNAIKFTDEGLVELVLSLSSDQRITFEVRDTGIGIPIVEQDQVFSEFSTLSNNRDGRVYEGTGLGLTISRKLVGLMGGELAFDSVPDKGSNFYFSLPLLAIADDNIPPQVDIETYQLKGRVLLVDDSKTNRLVAKLMLESAGIEVVCACDGYRALKNYQMGLFNLILMDIAMPGIDGLETSAQLRQLGNWKNTPILALTAYAMPEDKRRFIEHGLLGHIEKPLDKKELLRAVSKYLEVNNSGSPTEGELVKQESRIAAVLIDLPRLDRLAADTSEEVLPQLVEVFTNDALQRLKQIEESSELKVIERHLHTLGSSAALYGLVSLSEEARRLETALIQGEDISRNLAPFVRCGEQSVDLLMATLKERQSSN